MEGKRMTGVRVAENCTNQSQMDMCCMKVQLGVYSNVKFDNIFLVNSS